MDESRLAEQGQLGSPLPSPTRAGDSTTISTVHPITSPEQLPLQSMAPKQLPSQPVPSQDKVKNAPAGWPKIAAKQTSRYNTSMFRKVDELFHRVALNRQSKILVLGETLLEEDKKNEQHAENRLETFEFDRDTFVDRVLKSSHSRSTRHTASNIHGPGATDNIQAGSSSAKATSSDSSTPDLKDELLETLFYYIKDYCKSYPFSKIDKLSPISRGDHKNLMNWIRDDLAAGDARRSLENWEDFITTRSMRVHQKFEWILYSKRFTYLRKMLMPLFRSRNKTIDDPNHDNVDPTSLDIVVRGGIGLSCVIMLLLPVALLLLVDMPEPAMVGVVTGFSVLVVFILSYLPVEMYEMILGFSAYLAVLITCLSNLRQSSSA
ncbi:uncharacterized protein JN550_012223 [Neoarthrinium moseri]|uniref:uncharacterized protein n=1 Tax=Neoarthrinium moseri TaxID=1658444 RepID=UPI001FDCEF73|nr:uncharacterized protein JN550_012223 [Neoarthrinium moseri]KAI1859210.1 hypothetical protein JN550_012223 [Neoarthrinium moseri]